MFQRLKSKFQRNTVGRVVYIHAGKPNQRKCNWKALSAIVFLILLVLYFLFVYSPSEINIPVNFDYEDYQPFEPEVVSDFDTASPKKNRIPKIIHQTWKDTLVPPQFVDKIRTFVEQNPDWEYYLWTDDSARQLIMDHYPDLLPIWDGYAYSTEKIRRADALRYIVLYHYGGVYADMDVIDYRPLDYAITKHPCVFIPEPYEQSVFRGFSPYLISNAIMMCAPKHPFLKQLVENLYTFEHMQAVWDATGPGYVTTQYQLYNHLPKEKDRFVWYNRSVSDTDSSPYFYKGSRSMSDPSSVYIANTQYFIVSLDEAGYHQLYWRCRSFTTLTYLQQRACVNIQRKGLVRQPNRYTILDHKWYRTYGWYNFYNYLTAYNSIASTEIKQIIPNYKMYMRR